MTDNQPHSEWIEFAETLGQLGYDIIGGKPITHTAKGFLEPKVFSVTLLSRTLSTFRGASILLTNGLVVEARVLVRSCYENFFWIGGLIAEGDKFAQKMLHADVKSKQTRAEFIFKQGIQLSEKVEKNLRAQMRDMQNLQSRNPYTRKTWH